MARLALAKYTKATGKFVFFVSILDFLLLKCFLTRCVLDVCEKVGLHWQNSVSFQCNTTRCSCLQVSYRLGCAIYSCTRVITVQLLLSDPHMSSTVCTLYEFGSCVYYLYHISCMYSVNYVSSLGIFYGRIEATVHVNL